MSSKPRLITPNHHIGRLGWLKLTVPSRGIYRLFTDSGEPAVDADITHGRHAIIETVFADLIVGPLANLGRGGSAPSLSPACGATKNKEALLGGGPQRQVAQGRRVIDSPGQHPYIPD